VKGRRKRARQLSSEYPWIRLGALRNALLNWCHIAIYSRLKPMVKVAYRLRENLDKLIGGFEHGIKMGLIESINGKIGQLRRQGRCSLHMIPGAGIIL
jgi:transposase